MRERSIVNAWPRWLLNMKHGLTLQNLRGNGALWYASIKTLKILRHNQSSPVPTANPKLLTATANRLILAPDERSLQLIWCALVGLFKSRAEDEILVLRHQLNVLRRKSPKRLAFGNIDRLVFAGLYRVAPGVLDALKILKPQTVIRWHRAGFRAWRWKSRLRGGRPKTPADIRQLICDRVVKGPSKLANYSFPEVDRLHHRYERRAA